MLGLEQRALVAQNRLIALLDPQQATAFRLLDGENEGVTLDRYGPDLVLATLPDALPLEKALAEGKKLGQQLGQALQARAVYLKVRPRQANTVADAQKQGLTPKLPVFGQNVPMPQVILENGAQFLVQLDAGLPTGIYLDQRENRAWLLKNSQGLRVLNTFAYTCAFTVAAALGGAQKSVSIDAAQPALTTGRQNLELNGQTDLQQHDLIRGDVLVWLEKMAKRGDRFDLVILDPPSYACVQGARFTVTRDYPRLCTLALAVLAPRGRLLACVNHTGLDAAWLLQAVDEAAKLTKRRVLEREIRPPQLDFPAGRMKSVLVRLT